MVDKFRRKRESVPRFKLNIKIQVPENPKDCRACSLHTHSSLRTSVMGRGERPLLIINRGLPEALIEQGEQFTVPEQDSLSAWLNAIGLNLKDDCIVASLLFCSLKDPIQPPVESVQTCFAYIERLIDKTRPKAIVVLGSEGGEYFSNIRSTPVFVTHHPSDVLIDESLKRPVWEVLKRVKGAVFGR